MTIKLHEAHFEVLTVTHPGMTLEELFVLKHAGTNLERTPHPGNWGLVELALTTNLRPEILTVDTVQGDDESQLLRTYEWGVNP